MCTATAIEKPSAVHCPPMNDGCHRGRPGVYSSSSMTSSTMTSPRSSPPFNVETTLTFDAIQYWAKKDPHRTALIVTEKQWKADNGRIIDEKHSVEDPNEWTTITYRDFYDKVNRFRVALHQAGVPLPKKGQEPFRILLLFAPSNRAEVLALLIALQAAGCVLLFGTPEAFGGIRNFLETMLQLKPDAVLANRMVYTVFRSMTLGSGSSKVKWIKSTVLTHKAPKLTTTQLEQFANDNNETRKQAIDLDRVTTVMFSSGTTGPPTPIEVTHRMLCFQAAGYSQMLQNHFGPGIIKEHTTITGVIGSGDNDVVVTSKRDGPWISTHIFVNFVMLDLVLGGTAVMQPMGLASPDKTVDADLLLTLWDHFDTKITSAPPALWARLLRLKRQRQAANGGKKLVDSLQMAFVGGAETSSTFAKELAEEFIGPGKKPGLYRVYGTTQVLPIALASDADITQQEEAHNYCAKGYGVCLGSIVDGLDITIDKRAWEKKGGNSSTQLAKKSSGGGLEMGELCVLGQAISPSMEIVAKPGVRRQPNTVPTRIFRSGDVCYVEPNTRHVYFLGRMAQAVDCGSELKMVPPVGVEMVALETKTVQRCAFVGVPSRQRGGDGAVSPTLVVQFEDEHGNPTKEGGDIELACRSIRTALERSVWAPLLKHCDLSLVAYTETWPVDSRHSSKTNRFMLRDWAAKTDAHRFHSV